MTGGGVNRLVLLRAQRHKTGRKSELVQAMSRIHRRAVLAALACPELAFAQTDPWRALAPGLAHAVWPVTAAIGDGQFHALRIDPARCTLRLVTGAATGRSPRTARQWAREQGMLAATNAAMFRPNGLPVGFAKADGRILQPALTADRSVLVFNADGARLIDRTCETFAARDHPNALQGIRMISCGGANVWTQQPRIWSIVALAQNDSGALLILHLRSPRSVHDFIDLARRLPLRLTRAMYLEGGPEATLYARAEDGREIERFGSYETGFNENDDVAASWPLPNVLGVVAR
jgi:hypothetical protein